MSNSNPPLRGRPRDPELDRRITVAVLELLGEQGYDSLTFEAVARRCRTSKASLYRRWPTKRDMVLSAIKEGPAQHSSTSIDAGDSLRDDLLVLVRRLARTLAEADASTALMLLGAGLEDPELCEAIEVGVGPTGARLPRAVIDAAISRGELAAGADPFAYEEVVGAALLLRRVNGLVLDDAYLQALVDGIVIPALAASHHHSGVPAGIFSGHPQPNPVSPGQELS